MNKSDFISDAVALDLGKSGVKVAETLEIQIGDEWWRLINSAEPITLSVFDYREELPPLTSEGFLDVSDMASIRQNSDVATRTVRNPITTAKFANGDIVVIYLGAIAYDANVGYNAVKVFGVNLTQNLTWTVAIIARISDPHYPVYYDPIIDKLVVTTRHTSPYSRRAVTFDSLGNNSASSQSGYFDASAGYYKTYSITEAPEKAYSVFWTGGVLSLKIITHAVGDSNTQKSINLSSSSGATALSAVPATLLSSAGIYMFYLRQAESVALAFLDSADNRIKYLLESESWATLRTLPDMGEGNTLLEGFGTITTPLDGEFFLAHFREQVDGNIEKPTGYSFPANLGIIGFSKTGEKNFRMFASVTTTLYSYTLDPDTMSVTYDGIATESWVGGGNPVMLASSGNLELIKFGNGDPTLTLFDTSTKTMVWMWKNWASAKFPRSSSSYPMAGIWSNASHDLVFFARQCSYNGSYYGVVEAYTVNTNSLLACADTTEVEALLNASVYSYASWESTSANQNARPTIPAESSLMTYENETHYVMKFSIIQSTKSSCYYPRIWFGVSKADFTSAGILAKNDRGSGGANGKDETVAVQRMLSRHEYDNNLVIDSSSKDGLVRITDGTTIDFYTPSGTLVKRRTNPSDFTTRSGYVHYPAVCHEKGVGMFFTINPSTSPTQKLFYRGAYYDGTTITGMDNTIDLTFVPKTVTVDPWNDVAFAMGALTDGEIPFIKIGAVSCQTKHVRALSVRDSAIYDVNFGHHISGGFRNFHPCGSVIFLMSNTGYADVLDTGALWTAGMGEGGEVGESSPVLVHHKENTYIPYPFAREGIKVELSNISKTTKITIPETQTDLIRTMLASGTDFRGSRCILRRLFPDHVEAGSDIVLLDGYIQDWSYSPDKKGILFTVSKTLIDVGATFPKRLMNMGCSHVFKGVRCGYLGADGICTKTKTDCTSKGTVANFGGFPWVAARQRRVMWR